MRLFIVGDTCVAGVLYQSYRIRYTHLMGWSMHFAYYFNISFIPPSVQIRVYVLLIGEFLPFLRFSLMDMWTECRGKCNVEVVAYIYIHIIFTRFMYIPNLFYSSYTQYHIGIMGCSWGIITDF